MNLWSDAMKGTTGTLKSRMPRPQPHVHQVEEVGEDLSVLLAAYQAAASTRSNTRAALQTAQDIEQMAQDTEAAALATYVAALEANPPNQEIIDMAAATFAAARATTVQAQNNTSIALAADEAAAQNYEAALAALQAALPPS
jgi:hypothetical protein